MTAVCQGNSQEVSVGDLPVTKQLATIQVFGACNGKPIMPELVMRQEGDTLKQLYCLLWSYCIGDGFSIGGHPDKPTLRQRTRCPPLPSGFSEPSVRTIVVNMIRPRQSDQDIDIKKGNQRQSSS